MELAIIIKQMESHLADGVGGNDMRYEQPNMVILRSEETDIVITSLKEDDGRNTEYPNQW